MNRQIEFITFPYSRAKFSIFSITKKKCRMFQEVQDYFKQEI